MKIEPGKYYKTRSGRKAFVAGFDPFVESAYKEYFVGTIEGVGVATWSIEGVWCYEREHDRDLIEEWRSPVKRTVLMTMYRDDNKIYHVMRGKPSGHEPVASVRVTLTEGEFEDESGTN
jgi:hypothetical protein